MSLNAIKRKKEVQLNLPDIAIDVRTKLVVDQYCDTLLMEPLREEDQQQHN